MHQPGLNGLNSSEVAPSGVDAGRRKVKIQPLLRDVLVELRAGVHQVVPGGYVFGTAAGKRQNASNVRNRVLAKAVAKANERLQEVGDAPLPALTPHGLRRTFASVLYALGEDPGVVMDEMGHTDPDLALKVYRQSMRRDEGEKERLKALVDGGDVGGLWTSPHSENDDSTAVELSDEGASRS